MLISAFKALLKSQVVHFHINAQWTNMKEQWTTVFELTNIHNDQ